MIEHVLDFVTHEFVGLVEAADRHVHRRIVLRYTGLVRCSKKNVSFCDFLREHLRYVGENLDVVWCGRPLRITDGVAYGAIVVEDDRNALLLKPLHHFRTAGVGQRPGIWQVLPAVAWPW